MKKIALGMALLLLLVALPFGGLAGEAPYYTFTQTYRGRPAFSPDGYLPDATFMDFGEDALKRPIDLFVDDTYGLFVSDEGNKRIVLTTLDGELIKTIGDKKTFKQPAGIYVKDGKLYVCDVKAEQVLVFDVQTSAQLMTLSHPGTALYGVKAAFKPLGIAVDDAGAMYVISKGNTNGIAQFSADGTFLGYFGANTTNLSLMEKLKRLTYTKEQLAQLKRNVPSTPTALTMDERGLVYTVTTGVEGVKRLSMSGLNIMEETGWGFTNEIDVAVGEQETIFIVNEQGNIMEYSRDGRVLFAFGGQDKDRTRTGLFINAVAIDVDAQGRVYVLDREKALVQRYEITEYAKLVHEALSLYQQGLYAQSREPWEKVARMNSMFDYAQMGLGRAYYKLEMYEEALTAFRRGGDKQGYSDAYWEVRNSWLQDHVLLLIFGLAALVFLRWLWRYLRKKTRPVRAISEFIHRLFDRKLLGQLRFMTYFPRNPADAYYGVKHEGKVSVLSASILYLLVFLWYMLSKYAGGFLFKTMIDGRYEVAQDVGLVAGGLTLFLIACNLICSIRDGEGTFKQMYCGLAYALTPYILLKPVSFALSFVLTYNEAFIISCLDLIALLGCLMLIVMMVRQLQNYSFRETIVALLLTLFTMLMIVIALVIAVALIAQLWEFIEGIWKEAKFYNEH